MCRIKAETSKAAQSKVFYLKLSLVEASQRGFVGCAFVAVEGVCDLLTAHLMQLIQVRNNSSAECCWVLGIKILINSQGALNPDIHSDTGFLYML